MLEWGNKAGGEVRIVHDGRVAASVQQAMMRERAEVRIDGSTWWFRRQSGKLLGERDGAPQPTFHASRPSMLRQAWDVDAEGSTYRIKPEGFLQTRYRVTRNDADIGVSAKAGFWSNRPTLDVDPATPLEHQVFLLWVAFIMRRRAGAAAASGGGGGGGG